ncbi:DUF6311 domain-containing protein [Candidatus Saccharibacteria bacterium]|nr:DUF6311 domain-containing protein [Candidatus Saccharibacteria bacterium]
MTKMLFVKNAMRFFCSVPGMFLLGALVGVLFFGAQFGFSTVNPLTTDWIWHPVTHDTAQHHIGWEFFRAGSDGATITGLAYPEGLPITFMDGIPLLALPLKLFARILPANFQYFGLWALLCYILIGGLAAVLMRKIWHKIFTKNQITKKAVAYYIKDKDGNFTAIKRLKDDESLPNVWGLSAASLYSGESFRVAVRRGAKEKLGVEVGKMKFVGEMEIAREGYDLRLREYQILDYKNEPKLQGQKFYAQFAWQKNPKILCKAAEQGSLCSRIFLKNLGLWDDDRSILRMRLWQILFVMAGALIFVLSPMVLARTLYHPALAAHWLILLGILLIWDAPKLTKWWKFTLIWSAMLVGAVLIHPYFLPMLGAMMLIAALRTKINWLPFITKIIIPVALSIATFAVIGGFALGSGAEIRDLHDKGFNLLSFANPGGYSVIPAYPNASYSAETLMWLGLGVWAMVVAVAIMWRGQYKKFFKEFRRKFAANKARNIAILVVAFGLLAFAIGVRVDVGPLAVFRWQPPDKIYEIWSAFRAAAREAWPFYYATILLVIYAFCLGVKRENISLAHSTEFRDEKVSSEIHESRSKNSRYRKFQSRNFFRKFGEIAARNIFATAALALCAIALVQFNDIWFSPEATTRREGFALARTTEPQFRPIDIDDLVTTEKHLVMLDYDFRYDQAGTYVIARTALENNLTLNIGFFARIPEPIWDQQTTWREKVSRGELSPTDLRDYIFATKKEKLATEIAQHYRIEKRGDFYFVVAW